MSEIEVIDLAKEALWLLLVVGAPIMLVALGVGLLIALFQALTQIQEMTLTFVPKIIAVFLSIMVFLPFMYNNLEAFAQNSFERMVTIGQHNQTLDQ